ncbi:hypothetical protein SAMN05216604_102289 [Pseudomonas agarici]|nr:hypothetical protein SAMN05216604_102289 [Pseudomonas agarici]
MPQRNEANTNNSVAQINSFTSPKRRLSQPVSGRAMALLTANEVMTQVPCSELTPRLPEMVGSATLAMVVSSTCIKVASDKPMVLSSKLGGVKEAFEFIANPLEQGWHRDQQARERGSATQRCEVLLAAALFSLISRVITASASASCH